MTATFTGIACGFAADAMRMHGGYGYTTEYPVERRGGRTTAPLSGVRGPGGAAGGLRTGRRRRPPTAPPSLSVIPAEAGIQGRALLSPAKAATSVTGCSLIGFAAMTAAMTAARSPPRVGPTHTRETRPNR